MGGNMSFIELKNIEKRFQTKAGVVHALDGVDLKIEKGEIYGIVGYSGAGKSTLIRLLNGLETETEGETIVSGQVVSKLKGTHLREYRKKVGMIFQHFNLLWSRTVIENIELPLELIKMGKKERRERALELLSLVGLEGRGDSYPNELSGGQKQRVGIARALASQPEILLSDESTSALDPQTTDEVLELLLKINKELGLTIVMITHEMHVIRKIADKVAVMEFGKVIEEGSVRDVFSSPTHEVTKKFISQELDPDRSETDHLLEEVQQNDPDALIVDLLFNELASTPVISQAIRKFSVDVSILAGHLRQTNAGNIGTLTVALTGEETEKQKAVAYFKQVGLKVEVKEFA
jgi:D-methionine transport system ATP-binding protein